MCMKRAAHHHSCKKGKRVRILLPNNSVIEGRFQEERSQSITITVNNQRMDIPRKDMVSFGISRSGKEEGIYHDESQH